MRIWSIPLANLDKSGLLGVNREYKEALNLLKTGKGRHKNHPQYFKLLDRFANKEDAMIFIATKLSFAFRIMKKFNINYTNNDLIKEYSQKQIKNKWIDFSCFEQDYEGKLLNLKLMARKNKCMLLPYRDYLQFLLDEPYRNGGLEEDIKLFFKYEKINKEIFNSDSDVRYLSERISSSVFKQRNEYNEIFKLEPIDNIVDINKQLSNQIHLLHEIIEDEIYKFFIEKRDDIKKIGKFERISYDIVMQKFTYDEWDNIFKDYIDYFEMLYDYDEEAQFDYVIDEINIIIHLDEKEIEYWCLDSVKLDKFMEERGIKRKL